MSSGVTATKAYHHDNINIKKQVSTNDDTVRQTLVFDQVIIINSDGMPYVLAQIYWLILEVGDSQSLVIRSISPTQHTHNHFPAKLVQASYPI